MVNASEIFGAPPVAMAWFIIVSVSAFHHSPAKLEHINPRFKHIVLTVTRDKKSCHVVITEYDRKFFERLRKRIRCMSFREDNNRSIQSSSQPRDMCMPPQSSSLSCNCEVINVRLVCLYRTLCYVRRSVRPSCR